jgi:uncharacterized protein YunC (DUF1805 family)
MVDAPKDGDIFFASKTKLRRARKFIAELESVLADYKAGKPLSAIYDVEAQAVRVRIEAIPGDPGAIVGDAIRDLLVLRNRDAACCGDVRSRAIEKKLQLEHKIKAMKSMSKALDHLIADCANEARPVGECTILAALEQVTGRAH